MIQELLGGGGGLEKYMGEERKLVVNESGGGGGGGAGGGGSSSDHQALRCPRCDSSNTKFCYYNNYNLTQPRHFCKTCRRYWTKGGALRNVPIGGGCRKNKNSVTNSAATATNRSGKVKTEPSSKPNSGIGLDQETASSSSSSMGSPFLWPGATSQLLDFHSPGTSQHAFSLAMLRAATNQNPNPNSNPNPSRNPNAAVIKEEGLMIGSQQLMSEPAAGVLNSQALTLDSMSPVPMSVGGAGSLWRSSNQQQGLFVGDVQSGAGMQELYQRLRASANFCNSDHTHSQSHHHHQVLNTGSSVLDTTPLANSTELGYWNSPLSWSDLHTTHGAFP